MKTYHVFGLGQHFSEDLGGWDDHLASFDDLLEAQTFARKWCATSYHYRAQVVDLNTEKVIQEYPQ